MLEEAVQEVSSLHDPPTLARELELSEEIIYAIETEFPDDKKAAMKAVLQKWIFLEPNASLGALATVRRKIEGEVE